MSSYNKNKKFLFRVGPNSYVAVLGIQKEEYGTHWFKLKKGINVGNHYENETFNLKQEINKLNAQLKEKEKYISEMNAMFIPEAGNKLQKINFIYFKL